MLRNTLIAVGIGAFLLVGIVLTTEAPTPESTPAPTAQHSPEELEVPADSSAPVHVDTYAFTAEATGTVETLMREKQRKGTLVFTSRSYPTLGSFVESVQGVRNEGGTYWMLYINGSFSSVGMSQATVVPGDHIEWRYE